MTFVTTFVLPTISVMSDDNGHSVNIVYRLANQKSLRFLLRWVVY